MWVICEGDVVRSLSRRLNSGETIQMHPVFPRYEDAVKFLIDYKYPPSFRVRPIKINFA